MRFLLGLTCVVALSMMSVGCSDPEGTVGSGGSAGTGGMGGDGGSPFAPGAPVTVSGESPFAECSADFDPDEVFTPDSEVEPWIAVNPTNPNHIAVEWQQDRYSNGACRGHVAGVSFDGGATWEVGVVPGLTPCAGGPWDRATDPWLDFAANGDLYGAAVVSNRDDSGNFLDYAVVVSKSVDGGRTWGDPMTVSAVDHPVFDDKESITADPFDECTVYLSWSRFANRGTTAVASLMFSRTTDCGESWEEPRIVRTEDPFPIDVQLVVMPDSTLLAFYDRFVQRPLQRPTPWQLQVVRSTDGGQEWSEDPVTIATSDASPIVTPDEETEVRGGWMDVAIDRRNGNLYVVWEERFVEEAQPTQIAFAQSIDGGLTWSPKVRIDQTPSSTTGLLEQAFLPSVDVSSGGVIGVTYYNFQNDTLGDSRADADHWFTSCHPDLTDCANADNWAGEIGLTQESFDYLAAPLVGERLFLGDYVGLSAVGTDFAAFFPVTTEDDPANAIFVPIHAQ